MSRQFTNKHQEDLKKLRDSLRNVEGFVVAPESEIKELTPEECAQELQDAKNAYIKNNK